MSAALPQDDLDLVLSLTPEFWAQFSGARMFVTGGTGFIGSWLLQTVQRANERLGSQIEMIVLTRDAARARQQAPHLFASAGVILLEGDVRSFDRTVGPFDLCVHAATDVGDLEKMGEPVKVFDTIVEGTRRILDLAESASASRFLLLSSGAVYGPQPPDVEHLPETYNGAPDLLSAQAAYGNGKRAAEWLACAKTAKSDLDVCIARIFALIGPGMPMSGPFAAGNFVRDALVQKTIQVQGDGSPLRSYLYMADLCVWLLKILQTGQRGQAYNVGSESAVSILGLAQAVAEAADTGLDVHVQRSARHGALAPRYVPDTTKAQRELGLTQYTSLDTALKKTFLWNRMELAA